MTGIETLLVELRTEELPPKALKRLGESFADTIFKMLIQYGLADPAARCRPYATPRRLAVTIANVSTCGAERPISEKLMPSSVAFDEQGQPSAALLKKLTAKQLTPDVIPQLILRGEGKNAALFYDSVLPGMSIDSVIIDIIEEAITQLPIPKLMRWGDHTAQFVRPVHGLSILHGSRVIPGTVMNCVSSNTTYGHRFMGEANITLKHANDYTRTLFEQGQVMASFATRRSTIAAYLQRTTSQCGIPRASPIDDPALLDEVTALVEFPTVYIAEFDPEFLSVPQECLILTMKSNQKYFPILDPRGQLINKFLIVSNLRPTDPANIIQGNERVIRARLSDAKFFFDQDKKRTLASRIPALEQVVYHNKLGSQADRRQRVQALAAHIAHQFNLDTTQTTDLDRAAYLAKADLLTDVVGEFPELQGIMGAYYAEHDGENKVVAQAITDQYKPRFAGDELPQHIVSRCLALADKLETLVGMWRIDQIPSGDKDPFALRRHAVGIIRILMDTPNPITLSTLLNAAQAVFTQGHHVDNTHIQIFMLERLRNMLKDQAFSSNLIESVLAVNEEQLNLVMHRLQAVQSFLALPEAPALAAANKRMLNLLKKSDAQDLHVVLPEYFQESAEQQLYQQLLDLEPQIESLLSVGDDTTALKKLALIKPHVDQFFEHVMVNVEDPLIRKNRLSLLQRLVNLMNRSADLSRLAQ